MSPTEDLQQELNARIDSIEEAYEYFLAYASQGLPADSGGDSGRQARQYLQRCDTALNGLGDVLNRYVDGHGLDPSAAYRGFIAVTDRDARDSQAAIQMVLALTAIGSQAWCPRPTAAGRDVRGTAGA